MNDDDDAGWTELRVHGVSGTSPESMLQHLDVKRVAGDADAGFYRGRDQAGFHGGRDQAGSYGGRDPSGFYRGRDPSGELVEAYSWGGLTAGRGRRALWLLLTPFMLVNLAFWMLPEAPAADVTAFRRAVRRAAETIQRLFALSITATMVVAFAQASMDLIGWQCGRPGRSCAMGRGWLGFLTEDPLNTPARRVLVTAAVPLAVSLLLWWLGRTTWLRTEKRDVPRAGADGPEHPPSPLDDSLAHSPSPIEDGPECSPSPIEGGPECSPSPIEGGPECSPSPHEGGPEHSPSPLEDSQMWNGREQVRRLRSLHVATAIALVAMFVAAPLAGRARLADTVLTLVLALLASIVVLACQCRLVDRRRSLPSPTSSTRDPFTLLPAAAVVLAVLAGVAAWRADGRDLRTGDSLPWLLDTMQSLSFAQVGLLVLMSAAVALLHRWRPRVPVTVEVLHGGTAERDRPAWCGMGAVLLMVIALAMSAGLSAGLGIRVADILAADGSANAYVVPAAYAWAAASTVPLLAGLLLLGGTGGIWLLTKARREARERVARVYRRNDDAERAAAIARSWAYARAGDIGQVLAAAAVVLTVVVIVVGTAGFLVDEQLVLRRARTLVNVGTFLVGGLVLGMLWVGRQAYRNPRFRRTVGVLWDIGTFWPRVVHPFAPPCYAERAVPDLMTRICHLGRDGLVLLSCHSQGSVIGLSVIMQLTGAERARVALLTYGSPLRRLYSRFFPGYFGTAVLLRTGASLLTSERYPDGPSRPADRHRWPWRNLHRPTDPIGGPIFATYPVVPGTRHDIEDVDVQLLDPAFDKADGDPCYPATHGHSNYYADATFAEAASKLRDLRRPAPPAPASGDEPRPGPAAPTDPASSPADRSPADRSPADRSPADRSPADRSPAVS